MFVSTCRNIVSGLCATRILYGRKIREILSDVPLMLGIVAVVVELFVSLGSLCL